jgi:hypothetical protein
LPRIYPQKIRGLKRYKDVDEIVIQQLALLIEKKGNIRLSDYYRPEIIVSNPDLAEREILLKCDGCIYPNAGRVQDREQVLPLLQRAKRYFGSLKQKQAEIAIEMIQRAKGKSEGRRDALNDLAKRFDRLTTG